MYKWILIFLLIPSVCFAKEISRENLSVDASYVSDGNTFFMVNMKCSEENTALPNVINNTFIRCNIINCLLGESNVFEKSNYIPEQPIVVEEPTYEELKAENVELKSLLSVNSIALPVKEISK